MADTPPESTAYTRTLQRAARTVGGVEGLAALLHVSAADMARWILGDGRPPQDIFLAALDIVSGAGWENQARQSQEAADRAQGAADRAQARADRHRAEADRMHGRNRDDQLRGMTAGEQQQASNQPDSKSKSEGSE